jgi:FlaA1/EpsC-like NDP-sugar epimerase
MENNPTEAINNNVLATYNLAKIAERNGIYKFVYISTDKAVNPTSVMGCSKRIAELSLLNLFKTSTTRYITVRFGNVIGSQGSVVEIFKRQIKLGGPLTVTHPKMKRFFMTISEAVRLTLYAGYIGRHGDILILDMGEQIPILTVAENMIRLAGYDPYLDINILFTGIRPGEKLCEELWNSYEIAIPTDHPKINKTIYNETENEFDESSFFELLDLGKNHGDEKQIKFILKKLVPSYNLVVEEPIQKVNRVMK